MLSTCMYTYRDDPPSPARLPALSGAHLECYTAISIASCAGQGELSSSSASMLDKHRRSACDLIA